MDKGLIKIEKIKLEIDKLTQELNKIEQAIKNKYSEDEEEYKLIKLNNAKKFRDEVKNVKKLKLKIILEIIACLPIILIIIFAPVISSTVTTIFQAGIIASIGTISSFALPFSYLDIKKYMSLKKYLKVENLEKAEKEVEQAAKELKLYKQKRNQKSLTSVDLEFEKQNIVNRISKLEKQIKSIEQIRNDVINNYIMNNPELDNILNESYDSLEKQAKK